MSNIPQDLRYTKEHEYLKSAGDVVVIGITDYAQGELGDVVYVDLPKVGASFDKMQVFGTIEAVKALSDLYCPVAGEVVERNPLQIFYPAELETLFIPDMKKQIKDKKWLKLEKKMIQECCACGHRHLVEFKIKNNEIFAKWRGIKRNNCKSWRDNLPKKSRGSDLIMPASFAGAEKVSQPTIFIIAPPVGIYLRIWKT